MHNKRISGYFSRKDFEDFVSNYELDPEKFTPQDENVIHLEEIPNNATILATTAPLKASMGYGVVVGLPQSLCGIKGRLIFIPENK